ncbi:MAG: hypothetical protein JJE29_01070 [Peptostreptococcaceae bacterium]|nr:hypothetical protein [Peptostreptococcaceae bacterium]
MFKGKLFSFKRKIISIDELSKIASVGEYYDFAMLVEGFIEKGILKPVKSSGRNGRSPSVFNEYRIIRPKADYAEAIEDIKKLHPRFDHSKYAKRPSDYIKNKREIDLLSDFLWKNEGQFNEVMSVNERSFQIWGEEKLLKGGSVVKKIFKYNGWDMSELNCFETPEPFFDYVFSFGEKTNVLILENKDTWFGLRKIMKEESKNRLFREYNVLLYGEGKKIISRRMRLEDYNFLLGNSNNRYFYFGDLDYEGIDIFQKLVLRNEGISISLCTELYTWMVEESKKYELPFTKKGQKEVDVSGFLSWFCEDDALVIRNILESRRYIPQEILNYAMLKKCMDKGEA